MYYIYFHSPGAYCHKLSFYLWDFFLLLPFCDSVTIDKQFTMICNLFEFVYTISLIKDSIEKYWFLLKKKPSKQNKYFVPIFRTMICSYFAFHTKIVDLHSVVMPSRMTKKYHDTAPWYSFSMRQSIFAYKCRIKILFSIILMENGFGQLAQCDLFMLVIVHAPLSNGARIQQTGIHIHTLTRLCETRIKTTTECHFCYFSLIIRFLTCNFSVNRWIKLLI